MEAAGSPKRLQKTRTHIGRRGEMAFHEQQTTARSEIGWHERTARCASAVQHGNTCCTGRLLPQIPNGRERNVHYIARMLHVLAIITRNAQVKGSQIYEYIIRDAFGEVVSWYFEAFWNSIGAHWKMKENGSHFSRSRKYGLTLCVTNLFAISTSLSYRFSMTSPFVFTLRMRGSL